MARTKSVDRKVAEQFARQLEDYIAEKFEGNQTKAADALGFTQGHLSALVRGERKPGLPILIQLKAKTGKSIDEWLGLSVSPSATSEDRLAAAIAANVVQALAERPAPGPVLLLPPPKKGYK